MSKFNISNKKLQKIWSKSRKNEVELNTKDFEEKELYNHLQFFKTPITLIESEEIAVTPITNPAARSTKKGTKLPSSLAYNAIEEITLPQSLLPFLSLDIEWFPTPNTEIVSSYTYEQSSYTGNEVEVRGDGNLIYIGNKNKTDRKFYHTQQEIDDGNILEENTKKVFNAEIIYEDDLGDTYKINGVLHEMVLYEENGLGCDGFQQFTDYSVQIDPDIIDFLYFSYYNEMDSDVCNLTTQKRVVTWTNPGSGCAQSVVTTDGFTDNFTLANYQKFFQVQSAQKFKLISGEFVLQGTGNFLIDEKSPQNDVVTDMLFTQLGFWLYYESDTRALFGIGNDNLDGEIDDLLGLPDTTDLTGLPLPYTAITLKQNIEDLSPQINSSLTLQGSHFGSFVYYKISKSTEDIPTFRITPFIRALVVSSATKENTSIQTFATYDDIYTVSGTTYTKSTEDHDTVTKKTYIPLNEDVKLKYKINLNNPLFFTEQRNYKNF